jgi:hypothetical protein
MFGLKKCCECGKTVWWWQQSGISYSAIHKECHIKILADHMRDLTEDQMCLYMLELSDALKVFSLSEMEPIFKALEQKGQQ